MNSQTTTPDQSTVGGAKSDDGFFDEGRKMIRVNPFLFEILTDSKEIAALRRQLKFWFLTTIREHGEHDEDCRYFDLLDDMFGDLFGPALQTEILKSHNIQNNIPQ